MPARPAPPASAPRLRRSPDARIVAGVCGGLGEYLGIDPVVFRVAAVVAAAAGGLGLVLYGVAWLALAERPPGSPPRPAVTAGPRQVVGLVLLLASLLLAVRAVARSYVDDLLSPLALVAAGLAVAWHQTEIDGTGGRRSLQRLVARFLLGVGLVALGLTWLLRANPVLTSSGPGVAVTIAAAAGLVLVFAPWAFRLLRALGEERAQRVRSEARAEIASRVHDSVLQTLALIQRRADDPEAVASLARREERDLRTWLYGPGPRAFGDSFSDAIRDVAGEVDDVLGARTDVVTVGDTPVDERLQALVLATREALTNAAKFAGDATVSVYAEVTDNGVTVFVRDRGPGFDPDAVPEDRRGIRDSIRDRLRRQDGTAAISSAPGEGTEVELAVPRESR